MGNSGPVTLDYREKDGWHIFTTKDIFGLFVARRDRVKAYNEVPKALNKLAKLNEGAVGGYFLAESADDFFHKVDRQFTQLPREKASVPQYSVSAAYEPTGSFV